MTEQIEQLRADIESLQQAQATMKSVSQRQFPPSYWKDIPEWAIITELKGKLAELEAEAVKAHKWQIARNKIAEWEREFYHISDAMLYVVQYFRHLESKVQDLEVDLLVKKQNESRET